jgi:maleate isomerase
MYGWRARIGHVAPSRGDTLVYEFYKMFPEGFMMLNTTGTVRQLVDDDFERQLQRIEEAVQDLVDNNCDSIIFSGSPLFTRLPFGTDREMGKKLTEKFGVPVAAGLTAEVEALKAMDVKKLVVGTPYEDEINQRLKRHLEASGFEVLQIAGYGVRKTPSSPIFRFMPRTKSPNGSTPRIVTPTAFSSPARVGQRSPTWHCWKTRSASQ